MSVPPVATCPRCRVPVNPHALACHQCGVALRQQPGLSPPIPYSPAFPAPPANRWLKLKASLLNGFGGVFAVAGMLITLLFTVMLVLGRGDTRIDLAAGLACIIALGMPPIMGGLAMLNGARNIRRELAQYAPVHPAPPPAATLPEDEITRVEREIRELIKQLPRALRDQSARLEGEAVDLVEQLRAMEKRRDELNGMAARMPGPELDAQRAAVEARLETETDEFIRNSLRQQLEGIAGQVEARQSVETSCARLNAAYDAAFQTLCYLRAELQATAALASNRQGEALHSDASDLKALSDEIARTRAASEEVIRLTEG